MIIPVRCISCGRPISYKWEKYKEEVSRGKSPKKVLDELGVTSYCCRSMFITHVDLIDNIAVFKKRIIPKEEKAMDAEVRIPEHSTEPKNEDDEAEEPFADDVAVKE